MTGSKDLMEGMEGLDSAQNRYALYWAYYAGELPENFSSERIKALIERTGVEYRIRLAKRPVNSLVNRVNIASVTCTAGDRINARLEAIRNANDMELQEPFLNKRLFAMGDAYMFVMPVEEDEETTQQDGEKVDAVADEDTRLAGIELAYQSPLSCRAFYDAEDGRRIRFVIRRWREKWSLGEVWRAEVWYTDRMEAWVTKPGANGLDREQWEEYAEDEDGFPTVAVEWPEYHDFGEIPIKHARNDLPYGRSELSDFIGAQNLITKATVTQGTGIESHGWRERYRIADDQAIMDQARDAVPWADSASTPATTDGLSLPPVTNRRGGPGTEQIYHGTKAVGEFEPLDIGSFEDAIEQWVRLGAIASDTPLYEFDPRTGAQMSGIARKRAEIPMRQREENAKLFLTRFWREVYGLALKLDGVTSYGEIVINWKPPSVEDDPEWWATANTRRAHGVPQRKILEEAHYTADEIGEWEQDEDDSLLLDAQIDRLERLGSALQSIGAGATLLRLNDERVAALINRVLGDAGSPGSVTDLIEEPDPVVEPPVDDEEAEDEELGTGGNA